MTSASPRTRTIAAALAALLVLALPAMAGAAKGNTVHQDAGTYGAIEGKGTDGFTFLLLTFDRGVLVSFSRRDAQLGGSTVNYYELGKREITNLENGRLDIKVGNRGHFRGHFVAGSTKVEKLPNGCTGDPTTTETGYFEGSFVFRGERGFTTVKAPRENGSISHQGATDCRVQREPGRHGKQGKRVEEPVEEATENDEYRLVAGRPSGKLTFRASREGVPPGATEHTSTTFQATAVGGRVGAFHVSRDAFVFDTRRDAASSFLTPNLEEPLAEATVEPPAPFSGSATSRLEGPKTASWTGDLAVELPGAGKVALTGKKVYAGTCRGFTDCTHTLPSPLDKLLEAGGGDWTGYGPAELQTTR